MKVIETREPRAGHFFFIIATPSGADYFVVVIHTGEGHYSVEASGMQER